MDIFVVAEVERHMAGKIQKVCGFYLRHGNFPYGVTFLDGGVPVDKDTAHEVAHKRKSGTVNSLMGFATPAVLCAKVR